jgi:hypothetical protein
MDVSRISAGKIVEVANLLRYEVTEKRERKDGIVIFGRPMVGRTRRTQRISLDKITAILD